MLCLLIKYSSINQNTELVLVLLVLILNGGICIVFLSKAGPVVVKLLLTCPSSTLFGTWLLIIGFQILLSEKIMGMRLGKDVEMHNITHPKEDQDF